MATIAFIGLGNMGGPMAANLVKGGHTIRGFDLSPTVLQAAGEQGVTASPSMNAAVDGAAVVITMLPAGRHVLGVYGDLVKVAAHDTLFIDCSTIDVESARNGQAMLSAAGMVPLDAPVSGGVGGATAGTLTFMVGGEDAALARAQPYLAQMGRKIVHCGAAGAGQVAKMCNNMLLAISMIGVCEAFVLAEKLGLSHQALFDVSSTATGSCWSLNTYCPVPGPVPTSPANNGYKPGFATALMLKDLKLAQEAAASAGVTTPLGTHAATLYADFDAAGGSGMDFSGIINAIRATV